MGVRFVTSKVSLLNKGLIAALSRSILMNRSILEEDAVNSITRRTTETGDSRSGEGLVRQLSGG